MSERAVNSRNRMHGIQAALPSSASSGRRMERHFSKLLCFIALYAVGSRAVFCFDEGRKECSADFANIGASGYRPTHHQYEGRGFWLDLPLAMLLFFGCQVHSSAPPAPQTRRPMGCMDHIELLGLPW